MHFQQDIGGNDRKERISSMKLSKTSISIGLVILIDVCY
jgi:hypothetical protein